jgi:hypothetical protein
MQDWQETAKSIWSPRARIRQDFAEDMMKEREDMWEGDMYDDHHYWGDWDDDDHDDDDDNE